MGKTTAVIQLPHGTLPLPAFLPDATKGLVRSLDSRDLDNCGVKAVVMNTYHLMQNPGSSTIRALGGLHHMSGWQRPIITDSGGFQIYSLIRQNPNYGSISSKGATFFTGEGKSSPKKYHLSPEKSIQLQLNYGSDIVICLDDCTHVDSPFSTQEESVRRTIDWAKRSKKEYTRLLDQKGFSPQNRPLIFAVIQGGGSFELRKICAQELSDIGFDGYGYGGWPLDNQGHLLADLLEYVRSLIPSTYPLHALGVASPEAVTACHRMGYILFDGAMPTRDARHGRLYVFTSNPASIPNIDNDWFSYLYIFDDKHIKSSSPISLFCDCLVCQNYSLGYLHHLFKIGDSLAHRLATIHNLRFMTQLMENL